MKHLRSVIGSVVLVGGLLIAAGPFISVWRVGAEMLGELPAIEGIEQRDERVGWRAMFDDEFIVARRTLDGIDDRTVAEALVADGFEPLGTVGYSKECCGDYDAVWADVETIETIETKGVVVELTPADGDWQVTWPFFAGFGSLVALVGAAVVVHGGSTRRELGATAVTT